MSSLHSAVARRGGRSRAAQSDAGNRFFNSTSPGPFVPFVAPFHQGPNETGYVVGQNVAIEYRWVEGNYDRLPALAADLVGRKVDLIAASGGPASVLAAKSATSKIPIVFALGDDPVTSEVVASLARPGGNPTGISFMYGELMPKLLELLFELVPRAGVIALCVNPKNPLTERIIIAVQEAARAKGVQLIILKASTEGEIDAAFASLIRLQARALVIGADAFFISRREQFVALAARHAVPAIQHAREFAAAGGLVRELINGNGCSRPEAGPHRSRWEPLFMPESGRDDGRGFTAPQAVPANRSSTPGIVQRLGSPCVV
jgi:putative ABC transport system substrate-binding protein